MVLELCLICKTMLALLCSSMFYCFFTTLMVVSFIRYWCLRPKSFPPGPIGVPFLGLVHFFRGKPEENAYQLSKKYGPIISVRIGFKDLVYLNNFASIQKVSFHVLILYIELTVIKFLELKVKQSSFEIRSIWN